ncbi:hypothetical protein B0H13DRAFT_1130586 [Mycena leptocephala]|nr:hypothetical protein B0H13DRAFT_1130586 [Mycena leptocephala]
MPFTLNGTHINGGTFNNVSGNMSQVIHSHTARVSASKAQRVAGRSRDYPPLDDSMETVGESRHGGRSHRPLAALYRDPQSGTQESERLGGDSEGGPRDVSTGNTVRPATPYAGWAAFEPQQHNIRSERAPTSAGNGIANTTVNSVRGDMTQLNLTSYGESGIDVLSRYVVMAALHDSGERFPEPACHPGTRLDIMGELETWVTDPSPESTLFWLHGSAGVGKSAIAQMFAGRCKTQGRLGASFFFKRGHHKRGTWDGLVTTIAYQLAFSISEFSFPLQQAVESDRLVVGRGLTAQFQTLIVEPFAQLPPLVFDPVIVLDGLDECEDHKVQQDILRLVIAAIRVNHLPVRILITSRPEPHIRELLETEQSLAICRHFMLHAAYEDIRIYFQDQFSGIHSECRERGIDLGAVWPDPQALEHLVTKSSGIFIYAATVIRFVGDEYCHPIDRLEAIMNLDPESTAPLDDLYTGILSAVPRASHDQLLHVLHAIWRRRISVDPENMDIFLDLRRGTCRLVLRGLHSLLDVPPNRGRVPLWTRDVGPLHASFIDYLGDSRRSGRWCVSIHSLHSNYLHSIIRLLSYSPPTHLARRFYCDVVNTLPDVLNKLTPSDDFIKLLRNQQFHDSLFLSGDPLTWPQVTLLSA